MTHTVAQRTESSEWDSKQIDGAIEASHGFNACMLCFFLHCVRQKMLGWLLCLEEGNSWYLLVYLTCIL